MFNVEGGEYKHLSSIVKVQKGQQVNGEDLAEQGAYYVMNGGIVPSGYLDVYNTPAGTISISEGGNSCGYVQFNAQPFWSGGHCYTLVDPNGNINYRFLYHYLKHKEQTIMALRIGSGLPNIQKKDIERFPILLLREEVQRNHANILDDVTTKIKIEKQILVKYEEQKRYLLSNLFI